MNEYIERAEKLRAEIERAGARLYIYDDQVVIDGDLEIVINGSGAVETWRLGVDEETGASLRDLSDGSGLHVLHGSMGLLMAWVKEIQIGERDSHVVRPGETLMASAKMVQTSSGLMCYFTRVTSQALERYPLHMRRDLASHLGELASACRRAASGIRKSHKSLRQQKMEAKEAGEVAS